MDSAIKGFIVLVMFFIPVSFRSVISDHVFNVTICSRFTVLGEVALALEEYVYASEGSVRDAGSYS
jgi:hypothetical protein